jgi:hypothetical protein
VIFHIHRVAQPNELTVAHRDYQQEVKRIDSVLISGACELETGRLELKLLRFKGQCNLAHL